jgi:hypothetical protein
VWHDDPLRALHRVHARPQLLPALVEPRLPGLLRLTLFVAPPSTRTSSSRAQSQGGLAAQLAV